MADHFILKTRDDFLRGVNLLSGRQQEFYKLAHSFDLNDETLLPLRLRKADFAALTEIIIGQQVSTTSAAAVCARLKAQIKPLEPDLFLRAGQSVWREAGLTRPKQATLEALARELLSGELVLDRLHLLEADKAKARLEKIRGIGPWTSEMFLLACIGHSDAFPAGDIAVQEATKWLLDLPERPDAKILATLAEPWRPFRAIAVRLLWANYTRTKGREGAVLKPG